MKIPPSILDALQSGDVDLARVRIQELVRTDCSAVELQALAVADMVMERLPSLYENDDGRHSSFDADMSEEDWGASRAALRLNFSREKLVALHDMTLALRRKGIDRFEVREPPSDRRGIWRRLVLVLIILLVIAAIVFVLCR